jgi:hypothetical protein
MTHTNVEPPPTWEPLRPGPAGHVQRRPSPVGIPCARVNTRFATSDRLGKVSIGYLVISLGL